MSKNQGIPFSSSDGDALASMDFWPLKMKGKKSFSTVRSLLFNERCVEGRISFPSFISKLWIKVLLSPFGISPSF